MSRLFVGVVYVDGLDIFFIRLGHEHLIIWLAHRRSFCGSVTLSMLSVGVAMFIVAVLIVLLGESAHDLGWYD